jgi:hypothetical protein
MAAAAAYDVVVPYHPKDAPILPLCIQSLRRFAQRAGTIYVVSAEKPAAFGKLEALGGVKWIPESAYPISIEDVQAVLQSQKGRQGWYYQQFLKLYCFDAIPDLRDKVLLFDSDVVLYKRIEFIGPTGAIKIDWSQQYNKPYFEHAEALLGQKFKRVRKGFSGIVDHIMTTREIVTDLLTTVERLHGRPAWMVMLELLPARDREGAGFSEYELLFNWTFMYFAQKAQLRKLVWDYEIRVFHHHARGAGLMPSLD